MSVGESYIVMRDKHIAQLRSMEGLSVADWGIKKGVFDERLKVLGVVSHEGLLLKIFDIYKEAKLAMLLDEGDVHQCVDIMRRAREQGIRLLGEDIMENEHLLQTKLAKAIKYAGDGLINIIREGCSEIAAVDGRGRDMVASIALDEAELFYDEELGLMLLLNIVEGCDRPQVDMDYSVGSIIEEFAYLHAKDQMLKTIEQIYDDMDQGVEE